MAITSEFVFRSLLIGGGATLTMDAWAAVLRRFGIPSLDLAHLGRFVGHLPRGRFVHEGIARTPAVRGERIIGRVSHYAIGVGFAGLLLALVGLDWARSPTPGAALAMGIVTVLAPWFVLQPALGAGVLSRKTPRPAFNSAKSLVTHTIFGIGLFVAARVTSFLFVVGG